MTSEPIDPRLDQGRIDTHVGPVESGQTTPQDVAPPSPEAETPVGSQTAPSTTTVLTPSISTSAERHTPPLANSVVTPEVALPVVDPLLFVHAIAHNDLEQARKAARNRLRILTGERDEDDNLIPDEDGIVRAFGLDESHPDVARLQGIADAVLALEHDAELNLKKALRKCAIHPWIKAQVGLGEKQVARLLSEIGDPYWHVTEDRPRTVSELWAYCGFHVLPASQSHGDAHVDVAGGAQTSDPGQAGIDAHNPLAGVAASRRKGQRANWSTDAKTRAWLIAESCKRQLDPNCKTDTGIADHIPDCNCSPYRIVIDERRKHTALTHPDWTPGHSQADAVRIAAKRILRELWREARRLHGIADPSP